MKTSAENLEAPGQGREAESREAAAPSDVQDALARLIAMTEARSTLDEPEVLEAAALAAEAEARELRGLDASFS